MKQYLKMPLGFNGVAQWFGEAMKEDMAGVGDVLVVAAVHAIDSHDELVQMNQELLAALEDAATSLETIQLRSFGEDSFLDSKPEMRSYAGSRASVVRAAIAKAKGGAA